MMKHVRDIIAGIKGLAPGIEVVVARQRKHIILHVSRPGHEHRVVSVASSPRVPDDAVRLTVKNAKHLLNL